MRRLVVLFGSVLVSVSAWGRWQPALSVLGTPSDVAIADAGDPDAGVGEWFAIATSSVGQEFLGTTTGRQVTEAGGAVGVLFDPVQGCVGAVSTTGGAITWTAGGACGGLADGMPNPSATCLRARQTHDGGYLLYQTGIGQPFYYSPSAGAAADWALQGVGLLGATFPGLGVRTLGGSDDGLLLAKKGAQLSLFTCDGGASLCASQPVGALANADDLELLGTPGQAWALVAGTWVDAGPALASVALDGGAQPVAITLPPNVTQVVGLSFEQGTGDAFGDGFGMLAVLYADGDAGILSAVPDPANPALTWVPSTNAPSGYGGTFGHLRCLAGRSCVVLSTAAASNNALLYRNDSAPDAGALKGPWPVQAGVPQILNFNASDPDGDAVFVTWSPDGGPLTLRVLDAQGLQIELDAGAVCQTVIVPVHISDGVHDAVGQASFVLSGGAQLLVPDGGVVVQAGGTPVSFPLSAAGSGCTVTGTSFSNATSTTGAVCSASGGIASVVPPLDWCHAAPGVDTCIIGTTDAGTAPVTVFVKPWGLPYAPFDDAGVTQDAGTTATYGPEQTHPCATAAQFPGISTTWSWTPDPRFTVSVAGTTVPGPVTAPTVDVSLAACQLHQVNLTAFNQTNGGGEASDAGTLIIQPVFVAPPWSASSGTVSVQGTEVAGQNGSVDIDAFVQTTVPCSFLQGVVARVTLKTAAGSESDSGVVSNAGTAEVPLPFSGGCNGGPYTLQAVLFLDGVAGPSTSVNAVAPGLAPAVASVQVTTPLVAECGAPASGGTAVATAGNASNVCPSPAWSWLQTSVPDGGPQVTIQGGGTSGPSSQVTLETVETGFQLVGQAVSLTATATADGMSAQGSANTIIRAPIFVTVTHSLDTAQPEALSLIGVAVTLTNTTSCAVSGVELDELPAQMYALPASARVEGVPVNVGRDPTHLIFSGLTLAPQQSLRLTYSARPSLLVPPAPSGTASLNGWPISLPNALATPPSGCGCASTSPLEAALLLVTAVLRRSRGRKSRRS
jgi:hypothetical protein